MDEQQLITACRALDRGAQRQVYDLTVERVYRLILRMVRNADDAFDLTQEVYIRVLTGMDTFRADCALATWVHRIAVNEALAFLRRRQADHRHLDALGGREVTPPLNSHAAEDERLDVQAALDLLAEEDRMILLLRYDQGHDYRAIAELLDCAEGTVASRLTRARQRLRTVLAIGCAGREENQALAHPMDRKARSRLSGADAGAQEIQESAARRRPADGEGP